MFNFSPEHTMDISVSNSAPCSHLFFTLVSSHPSLISQLARLITRFLPIYQPYFWVLTGKFHYSLGGEVLVHLRLWLKICLFHNRSKQKVLKIKIKSDHLYAISLFSRTVIKKSPKIWTHFIICTAHSFEPRQAPSEPNTLSTWPEALYSGCCLEYD